MDIQEEFLEAEQRKVDSNLIIGEKSTRSTNRKFPFCFRWPRMATYRKAVFLQSALTVIVLIINAVSLVVAGFKFSLLDEEGVGTMFTGNCGIVHKADIGIHFLINVLSTALLSASNYCMQCLSAPTREDIDKAHAERRPLDIGIHSMKNLLYIPRRRLVAWIILAITSVPLHLLYNSVVFQTSAVNLFTVALVSESFIGNTGAEMNNIKIPWPYDADEDEARGKLIGYARDSPSWRNMTNAECIKLCSRLFFGVLQPPPCFENI